MRRVISAGSTPSLLVLAALSVMRLDRAAGLQLTAAQRAHAGLQRLQAVLPWKGHPIPVLPVNGSALPANFSAPPANGSAAPSKEPPHQQSKLHEISSLAGAVLFHGVSCAVLLGAAMVMARCMYDAAARWCHISRFHACKAKVQRVHEMFQNQKKDVLLCPYCVQTISTSSRASHPVVFLCGHRFHMDCANKWFREHPDKAGRCPLCEGASPHFSGACGCEAAGNFGDEGSCTPGACMEKAGNESPISADSSSTDELLSFILGSLNRSYPDIIKKEYLHRWANCHTEIWLSELSCPRYKSVLRK